LTNTPLHALTLMNDLNALEAARELAKQAVERTSAEVDKTGGTGDASPADGLRFLYRSVLSRPPSDAELAIAAREFERALRHYERSADDAARLLDFGQPELAAVERPVPVAAYLVVASMIYNLDEAMTHE
jgi:hypothetical protein